MISCPRLLSVHFSSRDSSVCWKYYHISCSSLFLQHNSSEYSYPVPVHNCAKKGGNSISSSPPSLLLSKKKNLVVRMRIVGLTGGIASGKSTVSRELQNLGLPVVDADKIAHDVLKKNSGGWKKVVSTFGQDILQESGEVDRLKLGQIVFCDANKRLLLNKILAPYIRFGMFCEIAKLWIKGFRVIVLDVPLLFEAKLNWLTKPIIVVWVDPATQLQRLMTRDGILEELASNKIQSQLPLDLKRDKADIVIDNSSSLEETKQQVLQMTSQITQPLSLKEYLFSRNGVLLLLSTVLAGVLLAKSRP